MNRQYSVVIERDEDGYFVASVPAVPGCQTQAKSLDELMDRVSEAIADCVDRNYPEVCHRLCLLKGDNIAEN